MVETPCPRGKSSASAHSLCPLTMPVTRVQTLRADLQGCLTLCPAPPAKAAVILSASLSHCSVWQVPMRSMGRALDIEAGLPGLDYGPDGTWGAGRPP